MRLFLSHNFCSDDVYLFAATPSDIPVEQAPVTEIQIFAICGAVGVNWRDLGTVLGIESDTMDDINDTHDACRERARKVLLKWKQKEGSEATE